MSDLFGDTSYFIAMLSTEDQAHARAREYTTRRAGRLVTSEWVLAELGNFLSGGRTRHLFSPLVERLGSDATVNVVSASAATFAAARQLYAGRPDKAWSLTDCTSFVIMQDHGIRDALTGDHHFEQAGFVALLKP